MIASKLKSKKQRNHPFRPLEGDFDYTSRDLSPFLEREKMPLNKTAFQLETKSFYSLLIILGIKNIVDFHIVL